MFEKGKAIVFERPGNAVVKKIRLAPLDDETVVVKTKYSGISCGTELTVYDALSYQTEVWYPTVPGYEEVGEVVYVGKKASLTFSGEKLKVGDRVMANEVRYYPDCCASWGGQTEYAIKNSKTLGGRQDLCVKIPDNVSYKESVIAYLAAVAKKGIDKVGIKRGENVLIIGAGTVGLSSMQLAKLKGAGKVIAMDIHKTRLSRAKKFADHIIDSSKVDYIEQIKEYTDGKMADVVIECSGDADSARQVYKYVKDGGWEIDDDGCRIHFQGYYIWAIPIDPYQRWFTKNMRISMSCQFKPGDKDAILKLISEKKFDAKSLFSDEYSVDDAPKAYKDLKKNRYEILKILLKW
ncbi:MAG TPA: zinc-binding dehydrogenase [Elusimicrobia bacterium]|nr:zinc-binding dehydrogenase [Elusimicrobiota bacterium]